MLSAIKTLNRKLSFILIVNVLMWVFIVLAMIDALFVHYSVKELVGAIILMILNAVSLYRRRKRSVRIIQDEH